MKYFISFQEKKIQIPGMQMQFDNIKSTNYFESFKTDHLPVEGKQLYEAYNQCSQVKRSAICEEKWESFTQYYWPTK